MIRHIGLVCIIIAAGTRLLRTDVVEGRHEITFGEENCFKFVENEPMFQHKLSSLHRSIQFQR